MRFPSALATLVLGVVAVSAAGAQEPAPSASTDRPLRIISFGAHPDDCEINASGVARMWAAQGHAVKFVSVTNGDIGHYAMSGGELALVRKGEVEECARLLGIETEVLDNHDGELMPSLENRKTIARLIRDWQADIVLAPRTNDYHPDHRYTAILVQDAAYMVAVPYFTPFAPRVTRNPVFLYYHDRFEKPYPFEPTLVVGIDEHAGPKWECMAALRSQFSDWNAWMEGTLDQVPREEEARRRYIAGRFQARDAAIAEKYRDRLIALYGERRGRAIRWAEAFELSEYGSQPSLEQLKELFPFFSDP